MIDLAKGIILLGAALIVVGLLLMLFPRVPFFGKLPGDFLIKRDNVTFSFPLATSIVVSIIISLILYLIGRFR